MRLVFLGLTILESTCDLGTYNFEAQDFKIYVLSNYDFGTYSLEFILSGILLRDLCFWGSRLWALHDFDIFLLGPMILGLTVQDLYVYSYIFGYFTSGVIVLEPVNFGLT